MCVAVVAPWAVASMVPVGGLLLHQSPQSLTSVPSPQCRWNQCFHRHHRCRPLQHWSGGIRCCQTSPPSFKVRYVYWEGATPAFQINGLSLFTVILSFLVRPLCSIYIQTSINLLGYGKALLDGSPSSRDLEAGDRQLDPGPTEVPAAGDCQLDLGPTEVCQPATRSGLRTDPGEDQGGSTVLTTVVRQGPASAGGHSAGVFSCQNRSHQVGPENQP